jgi:hypothetical protein
MKMFLRLQGQQDSSGDNHVGVYISIYKLVYGLKSTTECRCICQK